MTAPTQRVEALEAEAIRTTEVLDRIEANISHLTDGLDVLSADQREFRQDMMEHLGVVDKRLDGLDKRLGGMDEQLGGISQEQVRQGATLAAIARHLGIVDRGDERREV